MKVKKKGLMKLPVVGYGVQTGLHPDISINYRTLLQKPAICWGNCGMYPKAASFNILKNQIKDICGFGWGNTIESLYYYDGAHTAYRFPFHVQLFFGESKPSKGGNTPVVKTCNRYEITLYDPITSTRVISVSGELKNWNSNFNAKHIERIGLTMKRFIDAILNTNHIKDLVKEFKKTI